MAGMAQDGCLMGIFNGPAILAQSGFLSVMVYRNHAEHRQTDRDTFCSYYSLKPNEPAFYSVVKKNRFIYKTPLRVHFTVA